MHLTADGSSVASIKMTRVGTASVPSTEGPTILARTGRENFTGRVGTSSS